MALSFQTSKNGTNGHIKSTWAFLFPGQGSQEVGMGLDLYQKSPAARRIFDEADQALETSLTKIMFNGPNDELERTVNSQPAILTTSLACLAAANEHDGNALESHSKIMKQVEVAAAGNPVRVYAGPCLCRAFLGALRFQNTRAARP